MSFGENPDTYFSIITAILALYAIYQTQQQIALSNKHQLFDRRLNNFLAVKDIIDCCRQKKDLIDAYSQSAPESNDTFEENQYFINAFISLTNNHYTGNLSILLCNKTDATRQELMSKLDDISRLATEALLIYDMDTAEYISDFLNAYIQTLISLYICLDNLIYYQVIQDRAKRREKIQDSFGLLKTNFEKIESEEIETKLQSVIKLN